MSKKECRKSDIDRSHHVVYDFSVNINSRNVNSNNNSNNTTVNNTHISIIDNTRYTVRKNTVALGIGDSFIQSLRNMLTGGK